jgi:hypothetical protein
VFGDVIKALKGIEGQQQISVTLPLDDEGYLDRSCPNDECQSSWKILHDDWRDKVPDERAVCPICGHEDEPSQFATDEQQRYARDQALAHVQGQLDKAFRRATPRKQKMGFLEMTLTYKPRPTRFIAPVAAWEAMEQQSECETCDTHYASVGAAFFCPACGHNSAVTTFEGALATIRGSMTLIERLPEIMDSKAAASDAARVMAENALVRIWSSFQRLAEAVYLGLGSDLEKPRRNAFQNLEESNRLWESAIGRSYPDMLSDAEQRDLVRLVQQRHVLAHQDGAVDQDYLDKSGDHRYKFGQRLVIKPAAVLRLADIVEKLATDLRP